MSRSLQADTASAAEPEPNHTVIRAGWLIDGQGGSPLVDQLITIEKSQIVSVAPAHRLGRLSTTVVDLSYATILPALMDAHVHLGLSGTLDAVERKAQLDATTGQVTRRIEKHLDCYRRSGVAALRDAGDPKGMVLQAKKQSTLPRLAATCWAWHRAGRYGGMIGRPLDGHMIQAGDFAHCLKGADHIKLIQSGLNSLDHYGLETPPQFSADQLATIANVAYQLNLPIMVHANGEEPVAMAIDAGCDSIEHGYFMGPDNLKRLADKGIYWVPTAIPMAALIPDKVVSSTQAAIAEKTLEYQLRQINIAHQQGVLIALGTDAGALGVDHGVAVAKELKLFVTAGMSVSHAVRCASFNAAKLMGLKKRGALRPGWRADLIAVEGPPEDLPENLQQIKSFWMKGEKVF